VYNIIKHANAGICLIDISINKKVLVLNIQDNGSGFVKGNTSGNGLNNMAIRTEAMHGRMYIETAPGKGSTIIVEIPYHSKRTL
jgi:two-component system NarL family sensor kinase